MTMYVAGKTTLDTLSILLTEFRAFSESQIARVTHLLRDSDADTRQQKLSPLTSAVLPTLFRKLKM